jgi:hypothetical protein
VTIFGQVKHLDTTTPDPQKPAQLTTAEWVVADSGIGSGVEHQAEIVLPFKHSGTLKSRAPVLSQT